MVLRSISLKDIFKLIPYKRINDLIPLIKVANALQKVSGVTIEKSGSGEARYPIIRGMEKRYINTLVNGIKVGDSTIDIEEGRNAGCLYNIGVTTGAHTKEELSTASPSYIFDNIYDLKSVITSLNNIH